MKYDEMRLRVRRLCVITLLLFISIDISLCQVSPARRTGTSQPRPLPSAIIRRQRKLERDLTTLKNQILTLEYRLTVRMSAVVSERLEEAIPSGLVSLVGSHGTQIQQIVQRLDTVESDVQTLKDERRATEGDRVIERGRGFDSSSIDALTSKLTTLEQSIEVLNNTVVTNSGKQRGSEDSEILSSNPCDTCEESVKDLRKEIAKNLTRVQNLVTRRDSARIAGQQVNRAKSRRSNSKTTTAPFEYAGSDLEYNVVGVDIYDDYGEEDNTTIKEYDSIEEPTQSGPDSIEQREKPTRNHVSNLLTQETREIINGLYFRLHSHESLMENLLEMYTNNSRILDGFENRFDTIINAFDRADSRDTELNGGIRSNRRMLEAFAKSFREIVQDGRRQSSAIVNLRKRLRNIEGISPKSFARKYDLQSLRVFVNRTINRFSKTKAGKIQGSVVSNEPIKRLLNTAIDSLNYTIIQNQEAIKRLEVLPTTVQFLESELSSYSLDIESIPQLRDDVEGVVSMKNLVLRNSADISKIHNSVTTNEVSLVEFYSKLNDLGIDIEELQRSMQNVQMENSALHSGIGKLNNTAINAAHRLSYFKNLITHNISEAFYEIEQLSSATTATENKVQSVDAALTNLKYITNGRERSFEIYKATFNSSLHQIDSSLSLLDRSLVQISDEISKTNVKIDDEVNASISRDKQRKDSVKDVKDEVADLKSTMERIREEDFNAATERNEMASKIDVMNENFENHETSLATLQRQIEEVGVNVIDTDSRINSLDNTATQFIEFEEATDRRFRTELNVTRHIRQQLLEQVSKLQSIDIKMHQLVNSVKTAQNNIIGQREEFKALLDRSTNQSVSLQRLTQRLQSDFAGSNVTRELYRKINELHQMIGNVKNEINVFSAKETAQKARFDGIEKDVSNLQSSSWEHKNKNSDQDNLLDRLKSELNQTKAKDQSMDETLRNSEGVLQQIKQRTERNELDLTEFKDWRDEVDYAVYFLDKVTISLANNSRDSVVTNRLLATRVAELESQGQSHDSQIDTVKRIVDSNAEGIVQQYSQINDLVKKDAELETSLKDTNQNVAGIEHLQSELTAIGDRTNQMSTSISKHENQITNLGVSTNIIYEEVNSTVNRLNLLVVDIHDENERIFTEQNKIVRNVDDLKRRISKSNTTTMSNQAALRRLSDGLSSNKAILQNLSLSIDEIETVMGTSADLRQVNSTVQKLFRNMSHGIIENDEKVKKLEERTSQISDGVKSIENGALNRDILLQDMTSILHAQESKLVKLEIWGNSTREDLREVTSNLNETKAKVFSLDKDITNTTWQWIQVLRNEFFSANNTIGQNLIEIQDKINSTATNLSASVESLINKTRELKSTVDDDINQIQLGIDQKLNERLKLYRDEQYNLSKVINKTGLAIEYLTRKYNLLDRMRLENVRKSEVSAILQAGILEVTSNRTGADELEFLQHHIPQNTSMEDVDNSVKLAVRLAMLVIQNGMKARDLDVEMNQTKASISRNRAEIEQHMHDMNEDVITLSKNLTLYKEKVNRNSIGLVKVLEGYDNVSSVQEAMMTESLRRSENIDDIIQEFGSMKNSVGLLIQDLAHLNESVLQDKEDDKLKIANLSNAVTQSLNYTSTELMSFITKNQDRFKTLNESLLLKISALESSNVRLQLNHKVRDLNSTVHMLSSYLQDYSDQFSVVAHYIEQMKNSSGGLPMANAMPCRENSTFVHLCKREYIDSVGAEMNFVRYRDLFEHIFNENERVKDVPANLGALIEKSNGLAKQQKNLESTLHNYTKGVILAISRVTNETAVMDRKLQQSDADNKGRNLKLARQINSTIQGLQTNEGILTMLENTLEDLKTVPKAIDDVREEMAEKLGMVNMQINQTSEATENELSQLKVEMRNKSIEAVSHAKRLLMAFHTNLTDKMSNMEEKFNSGSTVMLTQILDHEKDIESLVKFRLEFGRAFKDIRNVFRPLVRSAESNSTLRNNSRDRRLNDSINSVINHFSRTLLSHMNGTDEALHGLKKALQTTSKSTKLHGMLLDNMNVRGGYLNDSMRSNKEDIKALMQQMEKQNRKMDELFETSVSTLNLTAQNLRQTISSGQQRINEVESKLDVNYKYANMSIATLFESVASSNHQISVNARECKTLFQLGQNVSATQSGKVEKACNEKVILLKDALAEVVEENTMVWDMLEHANSSISILNNSITTVVHDSDKNFHTIFNQTRSYEMEVAALKESTTNTSQTQSNIMARFWRFESTVSLLSSKHADNTLSLQKFNESLNSTAELTQNHHASLLDFTNNLSHLHNQLLNSREESKLRNGELAMLSKSVSELWNESNHQKIQLRNHSYQIELLLDLEEQSSKYAGMLLDMINAVRTKHDSQHNSFSRRWAEIQKHKSKLDNITAKLSDEIMDHENKFMMLGHEISDARSTSASLWLRFERINSTVGEFREDNEMLIDQVENLTSMVERLYEDDNNKTAHQILFAENGHRNLNILNESLAQLQASLQNISEPAEGSAMTMESSGLEIFNNSIQSQMHSLMRLIDDVRGSVDQDLREMSDNTSAIVQSVSSQLLDRLTTYSSNCSCDTDIEMLKSIVRQQNRSIYSLGSRLDNHEIQVIMNMDALSQLRKFKNESSNRLSHIVEKLELTNNNSVAITATIQKLVTDSEIIKSRVANTSEVFDNEIAKLKKENSDLLSKFSNDSSLTSSQLKEMKNHALETEMKAHTSKNEMLACKDGIAKVSVLVDTISRNFTSRLDNLGNIFNITQQDVTKQIQMLDIMVKSLENDSSLMKTDMIGSIESLRSVSLRLDDSNLQLNNISEIFDSRIYVCEDNLRNLSGYAKMVEARSQSRRDRMLEIENALQAMVANSSNEMRLRESMQQSLQNIFSQQMDLKRHAARLDNSITDLSSLIDQNEGSYKHRLFEMQESCHNLGMEMKNETAALHDTLSGQRLEIQKLHEESQDIQKRQMENRDNQLELEFSHTNLKDYFIKSQAHATEKFLTIMKMLSDVSNDTDSCAADTKELQRLVDNNRMKYVEIQSGMESLYKNISHLYDSHDLDLEWMKNMSLDIKLSQNHVQQIYSSFQIFSNNYLDDKALLKRKLGMLEGSVNATVLTLLGQRDQLYDLVEQKQKTQMEVNRHFETLENTTRLANVRCHDRFMDFQSSFDNFVNWTKQNQTHFTALVDKNLKRLATLLQNHTELAKSVASLDRTVGDNVAEIQSLWITKLELDNKTSICKSTQEIFREEFKNLASNTSLHLKNLRSNISANTRDLDSILTVVYNQSAAFNLLSIKVTDLDFRSTYAESNMSHWTVTIEDLKEAFDLINGQVKSQETKIMTFNSSFADSSDEINMLHGRQDDLISDRSSLWDALGRQEWLHTEMHSLQSSLNDSLSQSTNFVLDNRATILSCIQQIQGERVNIKKLTNKSIAWDEASKTIFSTSEDLKKIQEAVQIHETQLQQENARLEDLADDVNSTKILQDTFSWLIKNTQQDVSQLQNTTIQYLASNNRQSSWLESQAKESQRTKSMVALMKEQLQNMTRDDMNLEEEVKNTSDAILILARRVSNQSSAIRLLSDHTGALREHTNGRLDNVTLAMMRWEDQNDIRSNQVQSLESSYQTLLHKITNNSFAIVENNNKHVDMRTRMRKLENSIHAVNQSFAYSDDKLDKLRIKINKQANESVQSMHRVDVKFENLTRYIKDSLQEDVAVQMNEIKKLSDETLKIGTDQKQLDEKLVNLTHRVDSDFMDFSDQNTKHGQELMELQERVKTVAVTMTLAEKVAQNLSLHINVISANMSRAITDSQVYSENSLQAAQASLLDNITTISYQIQGMREKQRQAGRTNQDILSNLTSRLQELNEAVQSESSFQHVATDDLHNAIQNHSQKMDSMFFNVSQQILALTEDSEILHQQMNNQTQAFILKQDNLENGLAAGGDAVANLKQWVQAIFSQLELNQAGLMNASRHLDEVDAASLTRLNNQETKLKLLHDLMVETGVNLTLTQMNLKDFLRRYGDFELTTVEAVNNSQAEASRLVRTLEKSVGHSLDVQSQRLDALMEISQSIESNQSSSQQMISSLIGSLKSVSADFDRVTNRQRYQDDAIAMLNSIQNETELQVELLSNQMLKLHERSNRHERHSERQNRNITQLKDFVQSIASNLEINKHRLSTQQESVQKLQVLVDHVTNASADCNANFKVQKVSTGKIVGRLDEIDQLLLQTTNNLTEFASSCNNKSAQSEKLISLMQSDITRVENASATNVLVMDMLNEEISASKLDIQGIQHAVTMCWDRLNVSADKIDDVTALFTNLSWNHEDLREEVFANTMAVDHHSTVITVANKTQNALLKKMIYLNDSFVQLSNSVDHLRNLNALGSNNIESLQQQHSNVSSLVDQLGAFSNQTLKALKRINIKALDNKVAIDLLGRNVSELGRKSSQEIASLATKGDNLEIMITMINETMHESYSDIYLRQEALKMVGEENTGKVTQSLSNIDRIHLLIEVLSRNLTEVAELKEVAAMEAAKNLGQFTADLSQLKNDISSNTEHIAESNLLLDVVQGELSNHKRMQLEENHSVNKTLMAINAFISKLNILSEDHTSSLDLLKTAQDTISTNMNDVWRTIFKLYNQTSQLSATSQNYARMLRERNTENEEVHVKLDDVQTKVELVMKYNLKNQTIDQNNSVILPFADVLTQLRKDVTQLNISAWNALSRTSKGSPIDYEQYDDNSDVGSVDKAVYFDFSSSIDDSALEMPYLLSNLTTVLQGIENVLYFVVPKTNDVLHGLRDQQDSVEVSFGNVTAEMLRLQDTLKQHLTNYFQYKNQSEQEINACSNGIQGTDATLLKMNQSISLTYGKVYDKVKKIDVTMLDGSRRLTMLERIIPFMESKQQNAIDMLWQVNETVSDLESLQQLRDGQFDLMEADIVGIREKMEETSSKVSKTEDSFVQFSNTSNRYRISLWKDVLDIINSTMEKVEIGSEVLQRGGERRDMLLVNAEKSIRSLTSKVAELQKTAQDADLKVSAVAQETKWNGNQVDTCLHNYDELSVNIDNRLQVFEIELRNQSSRFNDINNKLDSIHHISGVITRAPPSGNSDQTTEQPTVAPRETVLSPTNLQVFNVNATTILITWVASLTPYVSGYRVVLQNAFDEEDSPIELQVQDAQVLFESLQPDAAYTVEIYARKDSLLSGPLSGVAVTSSEQSEIFNEATLSPTTAASEIIWQCNFDQDCDLYQSRSDDFDWLFHNGSTGSEDTGPTNDHTIGDISGRYAYIEASNPRQPGDIAKMATSLLEAVEDACLEFFYHMYGTGTGDLSVWINMEGHEAEKLWERSGSQENRWLKETLEIQADERFRLVFKAERGSDYHGDMAVDDIILNRRRCPVPLFECDFQDSNSCGFVQDDTDDFDWERIKGATPSGDTGPLTDHTMMTPDGYYMYMESSDPHWYNQKARLITPEIRTPEKSCVQFFYHMHGLTINSLSVYIRKSISNAHDEMIWSKTGQQGNDWNSARVNIAAQNRYRIIFEATVGLDYHGDIGLDDVVISTGSCDSPVCSFGEKFGDFCYVIHESRHIYNDAQFACQEHGGNLATIKTEGQQTFIKRLVTNNTKPLDRFWIGLDDLLREGRFVYADKTPFVQSRNSFNAWATGEPNDPDGSEDCVAIDIAYKQRRWSDLPCHTAIGYICQYPSLI